MYYNYILLQAREEKVGFREYFKNSFGLIRHVSMFPVSMRDTLKEVKPFARKMNLIAYGIYVLVFSTIMCWIRAFNS